MKVHLELHVEPGVTTTWNDFRKNYPTHSIALDGFVNGAPAYDATGPYANFDHHHGVSRLATRSTSMQVFVAIGLGLFDTFRKDGSPFANIYVNDCDQDVCLSYYLLKHVDEVSQIRIEAEIAKLIIFEDLLDSTAGAYPVDLDRPLMRKQAWVFQFYDQARASGRILQMKEMEMRQLIEQTSERIGLLASDQAEECELDTDYDELGGGACWRLIRERGTYARTKLYADGVRAFISVREKGTNEYVYTIGRMSPFVNFPMSQIFDRLNEVEGRVGLNDRWGGGDTIGGSPRQAGSRVKPSELERIVNEVVDSSGPSYFS